MKLKSLMEHIIREAIVENLVGEGQPVGGIKNDHEFDAGRHGVMKAVNVAEKVGFDGKYVDDMESGVAVKKLHNLDEEDENQEGMNSLLTYHETGTRCGEARNKNDEGKVGMLYSWFNKAIRLEKPEYAKQAREAFTQGYKEASGFGQKPQYFKENEERPEFKSKEKEVNEMTSSGAAGAYNTPFAFSKNKDGSKRAMSVTNKMGYKKVKSISEKT
jgi:hypothetical protein